MKRVAGLLSLVLLLSALPAVARAELALQDTDRVLFFGANSVWPASFGLQVETFLRVKYPDLKAPIWHWGTALPSKIGDATPRLPDLLEAFHPTVVVLAFGGQEAEQRPFQESKLGAFRAELASAIDLCTKAGAKVVLVTPNCPEAEQKRPLAKLNYGETIGKYAQAIRDLAAEHQATLVDWYAATADYIQNNAGGGGRNAMTTDGIQPTPLAHALAADLLLAAWGAEPLQVTVDIDWQTLQATTTTGTIEVTRESNAIIHVSLKDFPMPWALPQKQRIPRRPGGSQFCKFTFHVRNAPPGGLLTSEPGGRPTPWLDQMLEEGFDMATIGPLVTAKPVSQLMGLIRSKNSVLDPRFERFMRNARSEPEYAEANTLYRQALLAEAKGAAKIIARTPRTMDVTLEFKLAKPPAELPAGNPNE